MKKQTKQIVRSKRFNSVIFIIFTILVMACIIEAQDLLDEPQKIVIDSDRDRLLVSNFGNGALVQIDSDGIQDDFIPNAGFVDGMDIVDNVVYGVGDDCTFMAYDLDTEEQLFNITFPGSGNPANYLSSVVSDSTGHLFISCPNLDTIYRFRISDQSFWVFAQDNDLNRPNGICFERENNRIVVIDDSSFGSIIHAISLSDSTVTTLMTTFFDRPDGIVRDVNGEYFVGGYYLPALYKINSDFSGAPEAIFEGSYMVYPTYDIRDHSLLITYYNDDSWDRVMLATGILVGTVSLIPEVNPENVAITAGYWSAHPDEFGIFTMNLPPGTYNVTASLEGYGAITIEDVEIPEGGGAVIDFELHLLQTSEDIENVTDVSLQNFPNPFNPSTTISIEFTAKNTDDVKLEIYNLKGQKIRTFPNLQIKTSSSQQIVWNGTDDNGNSVASGTYYCTLHIGEKAIASNKMILLK